MPEDILTHRDSAHLAKLEAGQSAIVSALGMVLDTLQQQTNLLHELVDSVRDEPGPSPVITSLNELTAAVMQMGEGVEIMAQKFGELPTAIGAALAQGEGASGVRAGLKSP